MAFLSADDTPGRGGWNGTVRGCAGVGVGLTKKIPSPSSLSASGAGAVVGMCLSFWVAGFWFEGVTTTKKRPMPLCCNQELCSDD